MEYEEKFFFNHYSLTTDNSNDLLSTLIEGIKTFYLKKPLNNVRFYFYTEMESFWDFQIDNRVTMKDVFHNLQAEYQSFFIQFISQSIEIKNIFENEDILNQLPNYDVVPKGDGSGEQYYLLALNTDLDGILLSFNRDIWVKSLVEVSKVDNKKNEYTDIVLKNIATKEHANSLVSKAILEKLPTNNIVYSDDFRDWFLGKKEGHSPDISKVTIQINECIEKDFEIDLNLIKPLDSEVFEIRVGSQGGLQKSQIRILFKFDNYKKYILLGLIKHGSNTYDYSDDINKANELFKKIKELEKNEI